MGDTFLKNNFALLRVGPAIVLAAALSACSSQPGSDVMATVDGRKIFRSDVDKYYDNQVSSAQQAPTGEQATARNPDAPRREARPACHR